MKNITMVVLTKSAKYHNYCVAGIDLSDGHWVRLVTKDEESHGAVSEQDLISKSGKRVAVLDVINVPVIGNCNDCIQPENVLLDRDRKIEIKGRMALEEVLQIHPLEEKKNILGNEYGYITETRVNTVGHSLTIIEVSNLCFIQEENIEGKHKMKAKFSYQGKEYENMSVTDPNFYSIQGEKKFEKAILIVSIGTPYNGRYYKFVSAIFIPNHEGFY